MKPQKFDQTIITFFEKYRLAMFIALITLLALLLRWNTAGFISGDTVKYFVPWLEHLDQNGGFLGIPTLDSDYPVAYQYLLSLLTALPFSALSRVKLLGLAFDFANALLVMSIIRRLHESKPQNLLPWLGYAITLFIPPVVFNSAFWGQCDNIYTFFLLVSLYFFLRDQPRLAFIAYGFSLSIKLQAAFFLPFLIFLYLKSRKFSLVNFLYIPLVYLALYLPALFLGKPLGQLFQAYQLQVNEYHRMTLGLANFWVLFPDDFPQLQIPALILTFAVLLAVLFFLWQSKAFHLSPAKFIPLAMLTIMLATYFLPAMHERYAFPADVLAVPYLILFPKRWYLPLSIWLININGYLPVLWQFTPALPPQALSLLYLVIMIILLSDLLNDAKSNTNKAALNF